MSFLEKNREVLQRHYPGFWEDITCGDDGIADDILQKEIKIEATPCGEPTLCINGLHVHSPRDPLREGQRLAEVVSAEKGFIVIFGFGFGYAAEAAAKTAIEQGKPVIIIEKHKSLFLKALELRDFTDFFIKNKLIFVIGGSGEGIASALTIADELNSSKSDNKKTFPSIIRNKALVGFDEQWYRTIEDRIRTWAMKDDVNAATHKRFGKRWVRNLTKNMTAIRDIPGVSHLAGLAINESEGKEKSLPVFLAAAGPSLDKIKPMLHEIYERCIIVAVDTSLRFFIKNGVQPDFVMVVDPQFWNSRHLDRCFCKEMGERTALIAESAVYPPVLSLPFKNRFLCGSLFPLGAFIEKQVDLKGMLGAGGSVATTAWDFARTLGSNEIWIAGLDLAFPDFKTHFRGARFEERSNAESNRFSPIEKWIVRALRDGRPFKARSGNGEQVLTDQRLSLYAAWFENQFKQNTNVFNYGLFQDGLAIAGLHSGNTEKFLALPQRREEIDRRIMEAFKRVENKFNNPQEKSGRTERYEKAISGLRNGLNSIKAAAEEGAEVVRLALRYPLTQVQQNKVLNDLEKITKRISDSEVKEIAGFLIPPVEEVNDKVNNDEINIDPFKSYLKSSQQLFSGIAESSLFMLY